MSDVLNFRDGGLVVTMNQASVSKDDIVQFGELVGVAQGDSDSSNNFPCFFNTAGIVKLTVSGTDHLGNSAVAVGDRIFNDSGTFNKDDVDGFHFGWALGTVTSGSTGSINILLAPFSVDAGAAVGAGIQRIVATYAYTDFTDGGGAAGTRVLTGEAIPQGAVVLACYLTALVGFAGDTTAVMTVGDGTDVDRYNTGTPSVLTTAAGGVDLGAPSGARYHTAAISTITVTVTGGADWGSVSAGSFTIEILYVP